MASKEEILRILAGESGPMNRTVLGKRLGLPTSSFQNQLDRLEKQGLVTKNEQHEYIITEAGHQFALAEPPPGESPPGEPPPSEPTEESLKTTEYQLFVDMGKVTGVVPMDLIKQTATHIWRGGDFRDLTWVWNGLTEMGIRSDLAQRWFHSWRSYLHQAIPPELAASVGALQTSTEKEAAKAEAIGKGKRDSILDANGLPLYVGEGVGDLDHDEAVRLSALRQVALARGGQVGPGGQPATPGTMADEVVKIWSAFQQTMGDKTKGKSYIVKPGEEGYTVEEVEEGKPMVITTLGGNTKPSPSYLIDNEGNITEAPAGRPIVIKQTAPINSPQPGKTYILKQTPEGMVTEEYEPGKPIIINAAPSPGSNMPLLPFPVIGSDGQPVYDGEGKPVYANLEPMLKWLGFQDDRKRADERHGALMGLAQTVRENLGDGILAIKAAAEEARRGTGAKPPAPQPQVFKCGDCKTEFGPPAGWVDEPIKCPGCGREYSKEELLQ